MAEEKEKIVEHFPLIIRRQTMSLMLKKGKKFKIKNVWFNFLWKQRKTIKKSSRDLYLEQYIVNAITKCRPDFTVKTKRKGKSGLITIPKLIHPDNQLRVAHRWLAKFILRTHFSEPLTARFEQGILDVLKDNVNDLLKKKLEMSTQAFENRTFSHFRWWKGV